MSAPAPKADIQWESLILSRFTDLKTGALECAGQTALANQPNRLKFRISSVAYLDQYVAPRH